MVQIKIDYGGDVRRFHPSSRDAAHPELVDFAKRSFELGEQAFHLKYLDDEDDRITITTAQDLDEAVRLAEQEQRKSLKIFVHPVVARQESVSGSAAADEKNQEQQRQQHQQQQQQQQPDASARERIRELAMSFLQDSDIQTALPDAVQVLMTILQEQASENGPANTDLMAAIEEVFSTFPVIRNHALIQELYPKLPAFAERAQKIVPFALSAGSEMITQFLPQVLPFLARMAENDGQCDFRQFMHGGMGGPGGPHMNPMMHMFMPMMHQFMAGGFPPAPNAGAEDAPMAAADSGDAKDEPRPAEEVIHHHVACDVCEKMPITGIRFKCAECPDFDLCSDCEARPDIAAAFVGTDHTIKHILIKYRKPQRYGMPHGPRGPPSGGHHGPFGGRGGRFGGHHGPFGRGGFGGGRGGWGGSYGPFRGQGPRRGGWCGTGSTNRRSPYNKKWRQKEWSCELCSLNNPGRADSCEACMAPRSARDNGSSCDRRWGGGRNGKREIEATVAGDVTIQEGAKATPGEKIVKTWKVTNTGGIAWPEGTVIVHCRGDRFGPFEGRVANLAAPGQTVEVSVEVNVPTKPGSYAAHYRLKLPSQHHGIRGPRKFGRPMIVRFVVPGDDEKDASMSERNASAAEAVEPAPEADEEAPAWDCNLCSLKNPAEATKCSACNAPQDVLEDVTIADAPPEPEPEQYAVQLKALAHMGFPNKELNIEVLNKNDGNLPNSLTDLLKMQAA